MKKTIITLGTCATLTSCGAMLDPAVMMTEEGLKGFTRYNQDLVSSAKASADTASYGEKRGMNEYYEEKYNERYKATVDASQPGLIGGLANKVNGWLGGNKKKQAVQPQQR